MTEYEKYIKANPDQYSDIMAAINLWGVDKTNEVCSQAMKENKKIEFIEDDEFMDLLEYKLK